MRPGRPLLGSFVHSHDGTGLPHSPSGLLAHPKVVGGQVSESAVMAACCQSGHSCRFKSRRDAPDCQVNLRLAFVRDTNLQAPPSPELAIPNRSEADLPDPQRVSA